MAKLACATVAAALAAAGAALAATADPPTYVRACATAVYGDLGNPRSWQPQSIVVGPFAFAWIRAARTATRATILRDYRRGQGAVKALAVVKLGRAVTVTVPAGERRHVALLYDPSAFDRRQTVANGEQRVTFRACSSTDARQPHAWASATQFNGGVIVDSPRCVRLTIRVRGGPTRVVESPFGPVSCP